MTHERKKLTQETHPLASYIEMIEVAKAAISNDEIGRTYWLEHGEVPDYGSLSDGHFMVFNSGTIIADLMAVNLDSESDKETWLAIDERLSVNPKHAMLEFNNELVCFYVLTLRICAHTELGAFGADHAQDLLRCHDAADHEERIMFAKIETAKKVWGALASCYDVDGV